MYLLLMLVFHSLVTLENLKDGQEENIDILVAIGSIITHICIPIVIVIIFLMDIGSLQMVTMKLMTLALL